MIKTHPIQPQRPASYSSTPHRLPILRFGASHSEPKKKPIPPKSWDELTLAEKMKHNWQATPNKRQLKFLMISSAAGAVASFLFMPWSLIWGVGVLAGLPMTLRPFLKALQNKQQSPHKHTEDKSL